MRVPAGRITKQIVSVRRGWDRPDEHATTAAEMLLSANAVGRRPAHAPVVTQARSDRRGMTRRPGRP
jgi:hypothetical protein